jgi:hypothetical protein
MKLATVNPRMDFNNDSHLSKDAFQSRGALPHSLYPLDSVMAAFPYGFQPQQMPALHSAIAGGAENQFPVNSLNAALRRNPTDGFGEATPTQVIEEKFFWLIKWSVYINMISNQSLHL